MGKRQQRYYQTTIANAASSLIGKMANIILVDNKVFGGKIAKVENGVVTVNDTKTHQIKFAIADITEIITDHEAEY